MRLLSCLLLLALFSLAYAATIGPLSVNRKVGTSKGGNIAIYTSSGNGTPVFFIHGNSLSSSIFEYILNAPQFGGRFRVVAMDLPGHGNSDNIPDSTNYNIAALAQICIEVLNNVGMQNGILVGHDIGGQIAIEMTKSLPNLKILALIDSPALRLPYSSNNNAYSSNIANSLLATGTLSSSQVTTVAQALFAASFRYPSWVEPTIARTDPNFRATFANSLNAGQYSDQYTILTNTSIPVVMFAGEVDQLINVQTFTGAQAAATPKSKIETRNNVGHVPSVENGVWVAERLAFWIDLTIRSSDASLLSLNLPIIVLIALMQTLLLLL